MQHSDNKTGGSRQGISGGQTETPTAPSWIPCFVTNSRHDLDLKRKLGPFRIYRALLFSFLVLYLFFSTTVTAAICYASVTVKSALLLFFISPYFYIPLRISRRANCIAPSPELGSYDKDHPCPILAVGFSAFYIVYTLQNSKNSFFESFMPEAIILASFR